MQQEDTTAHTSTSVATSKRADEGQHMMPPAAPVENSTLRFKTGITTRSNGSTASSISQKGTLDVLFLGTGVSIAVPNMGHVLEGHCATCMRAHSDPASKDRRNNVSIAILVNGTGQGPADSDRDCILVDAGKTMRDAILRRFPAAGVRSVQALLLTHDHADATFGLDDLRDLQKKEHEEGVGIHLLDEPIDVYLQEATLTALKHQFGYLVGATPWADKARRILQRNVPVLAWHPLATDDASFELTRSRVPVRAFPVYHGGEYVSLGFAFGQPGEFVYISDVKRIPSPSMAFLQSLPPIQTLVVDCISTTETSHYSHFNLAEALALVETLRPRHTYLTGMCCEVGAHEEVEEKLRGMGYPHVSLAWDGMVVGGLRV
ncbi:hypothetical protein NSK_005588 [Nannochloropsis salina CCMP1776]|jgi:phosphoribosyl 1,2-cyclic phosphodiesterase|uniref:Metallo-beta-lactamase domain-containing protein n=1 Tax=Nannochloropsis salina CCMP1776 TaxID=1027361 RepID=A0A4D9D3F8_9STRA|nr:hypothetical protein NSK_005588 [Nannochloropsis salina CCMP1776]|eukprot:TFJ83119.1 hypothetical protein NSK_005588 [Nannochloropsis salina CCMP1776]